jgi:hypothetical protein
MGPQRADKAQLATQRSAILPLLRRAYLHRHRHRGHLVVLWVGRKQLRQQLESMINEQRLDKNA